jgi:predicted nucleotidyltransferase
MLEDIDCALLAKLAALTRERAGEIVQAVLLFGSLASGTGHRGSDVDLLVLIEPASPELWHPSKNVELRKQLEKLFTGAPRIVDVWVRTISQFADASEVFGGVEYFARQANHALYWREARHATLPPRSRREVKVILVSTALDDAMRLLGEALRCPEPSSVPTSRRADYLRRSIVKMLFAYCIWHELDSIRKGDSVATTIRQVAAVDIGLADSLLAMSEKDLSVHDTRRMHRMVLGALLCPPLRQTIHQTMRVLELPDDELRVMPPVKS